MAEREVRSPVSIRGSAVGSRQSTDLSPGAQSNPSRGADARRDAAAGASRIMTHQEPEPPRPGKPDMRSAHQEEPSRPTRAGEPEPTIAEAKVVGPED